MFLEIDEAVYVNLDNVFHISWQSYEKRGLWVFHPGEDKPGSSGSSGTHRRPVQSRQFTSREEGESWLRKVLETGNLLLRSPEGYSMHRRREVTSL